MSVTKAFSPRSLCVLASILLVTLTPRALEAASAEERVDRRTQRALTLDAHPIRGSQEYQQYCSRCHGAQGQGDATALVPSLAGQRFRYLVRQLANFSGAERENTPMHQVTTRPPLNEPQTWVDLASHLSNLAPVNGNQIGAGEATALGRGIFHEQCASCHGADASGDKDGFVPSLRHQHYAYLEKQMHKLAEGYRHNVDEALVLFMRRLDEHDTHGLADYLSRLQGPGASHQSMRQDGVVVN